MQQGWFRALIFCAAYVLAIYLAGFIADRTQTIKEFPMIIVAVISIAMAVAFRRFIDKKPIISLGLDTNQHRTDFFAGLLLGIFCLGAGSLILYFSGILNWIDASFKASDLFMSAVLMILVAVSEEMVFRGYLLNNLMDSFNKWIALLISAAMFTAVHSLNPNLNPVAFINLFLGGVLLGINFIYTRTLWFAIGLHFSWNIIQGYLLGFAVSGFENPTFLQQELKGHKVMTGDGFGFEGSIAATGVMLAAIGLCYYVNERKSKNLPTF
jgi:uncharacterized protein